MLATRRKLDNSKTKVSITLPVEYHPPHPLFQKHLVEAEKAMKIGNGHKQFEDNKRLYSYILLVVLPFLDVSETPQFHPDRNCRHPT